MNLINKCDFCQSVFDESYVDCNCPNCGNPLNYKNTEISLNEMKYPYPSLNHPSDFIYPTILRKFKNTEVAHNKNRYNSKHFFHIVPIYKFVNDKKILTRLVCAWDFDFNNAYSVFENPDKIFEYYLGNFSVDNFAEMNKGCFFSVYTLTVEKETYQKFNSLIRDVVNTNFSNYYQLYTSINWKYNDEYNYVKKTFYEYAAVNYILHIMELSKMGSFFEDIDEKLISTDSIYDSPDFVHSIEDMPLYEYLEERKKSKDLFVKKLSEEFNFMIENSIYDFNDVYDYYTNLEEGAVAPNAVPLSAAALRSTNVYNKLYELGYKPTLSIYSVGNRTSLCPAFSENGMVHYIECNNNIMNGINIFDNYAEMESILNEVYNELNENSIFVTLNGVPSSVITFVTTSAKTNAELVKGILDLTDKYGNNTYDNGVTSFLGQNNTQPDDHEPVLPTSYSILDKFTRIEITDSSLYKYKYSHFKLRNINWAGNKHGYLFVDKNDSVVAFIISEDKPNDGVIYRDFPKEIINEINTIEVASAYKNKGMEISMIELMIKNFHCNAIATRNQHVYEILKANNYRFLEEVGNVRYFWLSIVAPISEENKLILSEAFSTTKRHKIENMIYETFNRLDKTGANTQKYKEFFKAMKDKDFDNWIKEFIRKPKANFYLEVLPNKNAPTIKDAVDALDYLKVPTEEFVYYRHDGHKDDPIRTRYKVPVVYVNIRRLQQILSKKNTYSLDINKRNLKTGQATGEDKIARISDAENYCLLTYKTDNIALKEFLGPRADSMDAKQQMYKEISKQGYFYMKDLPNDISKKQALSTVNTLLLGAGIENDTMVPDELIKTLNKINGTT